MARPRTEAPDVKRIRILDAARKILIVKGYQEFRMSDVAREADIATGTLYLYFKDKTEMYAAVFMDLLDRVDERFQKTTQHVHGLHALKILAQESLAFIDEHHDFLSQCTGEHPALLQSPVGERLKDRFVQHMGLIGKIMRECVAEKSIRSFDIPLLCVHFVFLSRMFMIKKIIDGTRKPLRGKAAQLTDLFLNGVGGANA